MKVEKNEMIEIWKYSEQGDCDGDTIRCWSLWNDPLLETIRRIETSTIGINNDT